MNRCLDSPPKITLGLTESCPLRCRHCYADCAAQPKSDELSVDEWFGLINQLTADGIIQIYIEGGEPLLKPGIIELVQRCARDAMTLLRTHATLIDDGMAARLKAAGVGRVFVDFMGADAATHEWSTDVPGSFAATCAGVGHLVRHGIPTDLLVILTRQTAPQLNDLLRLAVKLGAERVGILRLYPLGRAKRLWDTLALSLDEQMAAIDGLEVPAGLQIMQSWHPNNKNCCWQAAAINAFGRAIGCMYLREYADFGSARERPYRAIWDEHPLYRQLRSGRTEQSATRTGAVTEGGCRAAAYAFHGRWQAPDPFDVTLNGGVDLRVLPNRILRA